MEVIKSTVSSALRQPPNTWVGWLMGRYMERRNTYLEQAAVKLCKIEPHHRVLEVGFGPGIGLEAAYEAIKDGRGKVYGVDLSPYMVDLTARHLRRAIAAGKIELHQGNVISLPFWDDKFDRVFHCNCYYFWPDLTVCAKELFRVMKSGGLMVTTLNLKRLRYVKSLGFLQNTTTDPLVYMDSLEAAGFSKVHIDYLPWKKGTYQAVFAEVKK